MSIIRQGLLQLGTTVIPVEDVNLDPATATAARRSSGDLYPTQQTVFGGNRSITCTAPVAIAFSLIGLTTTKFTALQLTLLKIGADGITSTGTDHVRIAGAASATFYATLTGFSVNQGGLATAQIAIACIAPLGTTDPLTVTTGSALALSAQPDLHTLGPVTVNGSAIPGVVGFSGSLSHDASTRTTDGDLYPTQFSWNSSNPVLQVQHSDPDAVLSALGLTGASLASSTKVTFLKRGTDSVISATQLSITVSAGIITTGAVSGGVGRTASTGFTIMPAAADSTTHPWTLGA